MSCVNIVLFKGKVGANFHTFELPRSLQNQFYVNRKVWISWYRFLNHANQPNESYFTIPQNLKGERLFVGAPASLYNLTQILWILSNYPSHMKFEFHPFTQKKCCGGWGMGVMLNTHYDEIG